jgi:hypothetical protein
VGSTEAAEEGTAEAGAVLGAFEGLPGGANAEPPPEAHAVRPNPSARPSAASGASVRLTRAPFPIS